MAPSCEAHDLITRAGKNRYDCERYIEAARYVVHVQLAVYVTTISKSKSAPHLPPNLGGTAKQESLKPSPSGSSPSPKRVREPIPTTWGRRLRARKNERKRYDMGKNRSGLGGCASLASSDCE